MPINIATSIGEVDMQNYVNTQVSNQLGTQLPPAVSTEVTNQINSNTNIPKITQGNITYYVSGSGSNSNDGLTAGTPFLTIAKAISMIPIIVNHNIIINVADGTYNEVISLKGFDGCGYLTIQGNTTTPTNCIINNIILVTNRLNIYVKGFTCQANTTSVYMAYSTNFEVSYINSTNTTTYSGANVTYSIGKISNCTFSNKQYGIIISDCSNILSSANSGSNNTYALYSSKGSLLIKSTTQPTGTTQEYWELGGKISSAISKPSIATNGYRFNDDGTIEQWGKVNITETGYLSSGNVTVTIPIAFPNGLLHQSAVASFNLTSNDTSWLETVNVNAGRLTTNPNSNIRINTMPLSNSFPAGSIIEITWFAKGY